jgi:hypothetical protein
LHVEEGLVRYRTGGGAVTSLDVVGIYLECRLAIHDRFFGEEQVLVLLVGVGLVGALADEDGASENGARFTVEDALVVEAARVLRPGVVNGYEVVDVLVAVSDVKAE